MNKKDLIQALVDDCRTSQTKVEDFLHALADQFADALGRGEYVNMPGIGQFHLYAARQNGMIYYHSAQALRDRFKLREKKAPEAAPDTLCPKCRKRPRKILKQCSACTQQKYRAKAKGGKS